MRFRRWGLGRAPFPDLSRLGWCSESVRKHGAAWLKTELDTSVHLNSAFPENQHFIVLPNCSLAAPNLLIER